MEIEKRYKRFKWSCEMDMARMSRVVNEMDAILEELTKGSLQHDFFMANFLKVYATSLVEGQLKGEARFAMMPPPLAEEWDVGMSDHDQSKMTLFIRFAENMDSMIICMTLS
jgi:hypothetical protein